MVVTEKEWEFYSQKVVLPLGKVSGSGVVRDKDGNIKGEQPKQENLSGTYTDGRSGQRGG